MFNLTQIASLPVDSETLRRETREDRLLSRVLTYVQQGWLSTVDSELQTFALKKTKLSVKAGCLLRGMRLLYPKPVRKLCWTNFMLAIQASWRWSLSLHVWWCGIDNDIEQLVRECSACQSVRNAPSTTYLYPWAWPDGPWKRILIYFARPFKGPGLWYSRMPSWKSYH